MKKYNFFFLLCFVIIFLSCDKSSHIGPITKYKEYFPLKIGNYIIYNVDSTNFNGQISKMNYEIKDLVAGKFYDQENRLNFRIERYQRFSATDPWMIRYVWNAIATDQEIISSEQNISFVRMVFPVKDGQIWNINEYNITGTSNVTYSEIHKPFNMGTVFVDSSVTVIEKADTLNLILNEFQKRVYGLNTGLIYFYADSLELQFDPQRKGDTIGGYRLIYTIKDHNY